MRNLVMENAYNQELQKMRDILEKWMNTYNIHPTRPKLHDVPGEKNCKVQPDTKQPTNNR